MCSLHHFSPNRHSVLFTLTILEGWNVLRRVNIFMFDQKNHIFWKISRKNTVLGWLNKNSFQPAFLSLIMQINDFRNATMLISIQNEAENDVKSRFQPGLKWEFNGKIAKTWKMHKKPICLKHFSYDNKSISA